MGADLKAPVAARGGGDTPGYRLVKEVVRGDLVVHYDGRSEAIVGVSQATGERRYEPIWWAARGSYARRANVAPQWLPGLYVELESYTALPTPLLMSQVRERSQDLLHLRETLQSQHPNQSLYFPWIPYQNTIRTFQSYLAKFPSGALSILPEVADVVHAVKASSAAAQSQWSEVDVAVAGVENAAGRPVGSRRGGQGFATDQEAKAAVEAHAMNAALGYYRTRGRVVDTSRSESYDYVVQLADEEWHVEVKGTTSGGEEVLLTPREVQHAREFPRTALFVVSEIRVERDGAGEVMASGGRQSVWEPWDVDGGQLRPVGYRYAPPLLPIA